MTNDGQALRFSSHDFRRVFATEAVAAGLPVILSSPKRVFVSGL